MKKIICIFLLAWLPLFISAAGAASLQMTFANLVANTDNSEAIEPPCHQHLGVEKNNNAHDHAPNGHHHFCSVCGFCVMSNGFVHIAQPVAVNPTSFTASQPVFFTAAFHSRTYPPAIKPPILY